jgi:hypothetical protein
MVAGRKKDHTDRVYLLVAMWVLLRSTTCLAGLLAFSRSGELDHGYDRVALKYDEPSFSHGFGLLTTAYYVSCTRMLK